MSAGEVPIVRSIVAVGAGFFAVMVLGAAADIAFSQLSPDAFDRAVTHAPTARSSSSSPTKRCSLCSRDTSPARIALTRPFNHVLIMAGLVLAGRALIAIAAWDVEPAVVQSSACSR